MPGCRTYFAELDGETVGTVSIWRLDADAAAIWVATLPEARNRGISGCLMSRGLRDASQSIEY